MPKIQFANDAAGSGAYELTYNPVRVIVPQSQSEGIKNTVKTVDGEGVTFTEYFDSRRGKLIWRGWRSDHAAFMSMLGTITTYVDGYKFLKMNDIATALGQYSTYTKIKIIAVNRSIREGGAIIFDTIELVWENAET